MHNICRGVTDNQLFQKKTNSYRFKDKDTGQFALGALDFRASLVSNRCMWSQSACTRSGTAYRSSETSPGNIVISVHLGAIVVVYPDIPFPGAL